MQASVKKRLNKVITFENKCSESVFVWLRVDIVCFHISTNRQLGQDQDSYVLYN